MKIIPAILADSVADFEKMLAEAAGFSDLVHLDFMDGKFVPSTSISLSDAIQRINEQTNTTNTTNYIVHLMVREPALELESILSLRPEYTIIHAEADGVIPTLHALKNAGLKTGLALNPDTTVEKIRDLLPEIDFVLIMSVNPGFYGSEFIPETLAKVTEIRGIHDKIMIGVDGGVNLSTISEIAATHPDYIMSGGYIFGKGETPKKKYEELESHLSRMGE